MRWEVEGPVWVGGKKRKRKDGARTKNGTCRTTRFRVLCVLYEPLSMNDTIADEGY
jgi:hypothetical protein